MSGIIGQKKKVIAIEQTELGNWETGRREAQFLLYAIYILIVCHASVLPIKKYISQLHRLCYSYMISSVQEDILPRERLFSSVNFKDPVPIFIIHHH